MGKPHLNTSPELQIFTHCICLNVYSLKLPPFAFHTIFIFYSFWLAVEFITLILVSFVVVVILWCVYVCVCVCVCVQSVHSCMLVFGCQFFFPFVSVYCQCNIKNKSLCWILLCLAWDNFSHFHLIICVLVTVVELKNKTSCAFIFGLFVLPW